MSAWPYVVFYNPTLKLLAKESTTLRHIAENTVQYVSMAIRSIL